ncbi:MAG: zinc-ribbon domain containing protein, partial [Candidatus Rokubacteria bacterium]|nr:zinc-ribbon domain containing protein [Candidatus Rokubacteria bacterium]
MEFQDKVLACRECGKEFLFSAGEQAFYSEKGFQHQPSRCKDCRVARRSGGERTPAGERQLFPAICTACGKETQVPFKPTPGKPVYCRDCYA